MRGRPIPTGGPRRIEVVLLSARGLGEKNLTGGVKVRRTVQISLVSQADPTGECFGVKVSPWIEPCGKNQWLRFGRLGLRCSFFLQGKKSPDEVKHPNFGESAELRIQLLASSIPSRSTSHTWAKALMPKAIADSVTGQLDKAYSTIEAEARFPLADLISGEEGAHHSGFYSLQRCSIACSPGEDDVLPKVWMQVYMLPDHAALVPSLEAAYEEEGARMPGGLGPGRPKANPHALPQDNFMKYDGYISSGGDMGRARMTVEAAKLRCKAMPGCKGFTFHGVDKGGEVDVIFKDKQDNHPGPWTSYFYLGPDVHTVPTPLNLNMKNMTPPIVAQGVPLSSTHTPTKDGFHGFNGYISGFCTEILSETMTLEEAKARCKKLPGCKGFTFEGPVTDEPVLVSFRDSFDLVAGDWTSFSYDAESSSKVQSPESKTSEASGVCCGVPTSATEGAKAETEANVVEQMPVKAGQNTLQMRELLDVDPVHMGSVKPAQPSTAAVPDLLDIMEDIPEDGCVSCLPYGTSITIPAGLDTVRTFSLGEPVSPAASAQDASPGLTKQVLEVDGGVAVVYREPSFPGSIDVKEREGDLCSDKADGAVSTEYLSGPSDGDDGEIEGPNAGVPDELTRWLAEVPLMTNSPKQKGGASMSKTGDESVDELQQSVLEGLAESLRT